VNTSLVSFWVLIERIIESGDAMLLSLKQVVRQCREQTMMLGNVVDEYDETIKVVNAALPMFWIAMDRLIDEGDAVMLSLKLLVRQVQRRSMMLQSLAIFSNCLNE